MTDSNGKTDIQAPDPGDAGTSAARVHFVGAGPGAPDLITLRGARLLGEADVVVYAGSLVNPELLSLTKQGCKVWDSSRMTLEEVVETVAGAVARGLEVVRLHTGDPCLYGAIREQMDALDELSIDYDYTPGVPSLCGAAAALKAELTLPDVSQSVVLTRLSGRTAVPESERMPLMASHGCTMAVFLSASMLDDLQRELLEGGAYTEGTPAAIVYKATWPDEQVVRCTVGTLAQAGRSAGISRTALIVVGDVLESAAGRSKLYDPDFATGYRPMREPAGPSDEGAL